MRWEELFDWGELRFERKLKAEDFSCESLPREEIPEPYQDQVTAFRRLRHDSRKSAIRSFYSLRREVTLHGCSKFLENLVGSTKVMHAWCDDCESWGTFSTTSDTLDHCDGCDNTIPSRGVVLQRERGFSDARAGHSPSLLGGPYMDGYAQGKSGYEFDPNYRVPPDPLVVARARIKELEDDRNQILARVRALMMWVPKEDANRKWFEEL